MSTEILVGECLEVRSCPYCYGTDDRRAVLHGWLSLGASCGIGDVCCQECREKMGEKLRTFAARMRGGLAGVTPRQMQAERGIREGAETVAQLKMEMG